MIRAYIDLKLKYWKYFAKKKLHYYGKLRRQGFDPDVAVRLVGRLR